MASLGATPVSGPDGPALHLHGDTSACGTIQLSQEVVLPEGLDGFFESGDRAGVATAGSYGGIRMWGPHEGLRRDLYVTTVPTLAEPTILVFRSDTEDYFSTAFLETGVLDPGTYTVCLLVADEPVEAWVALPGHAPVDVIGLQPVASSWFTEKVDSPIATYSFARTRATERTTDVLKFAYVDVAAKASYHTVACWDELAHEALRDTPRPMCITSQNAGGQINSFVLETSPNRKQSYGFRHGLPAGELTYTLGQAFTGPATEAGAFLFWMDQPDTD